MVRIKGRTRKLERNYTLTRLQSQDEREHELAIRIVESGVGYGIVERLKKHVGQEVVVEWQPLKISTLKIGEFESTNYTQVAYITPAEMEN